ncbi:hypothetical protein AWC38_SpisGene1735 [Stylophora pistillata]|uniref:Uncharacterized protein n=1 Tax=Stylophora pistillata TaxID=50429 RepID=A0A2B4SY12_STYPI|nr:hypothetical protein AWC38_SpisGene1735 [Stylophora pistillata]
MARQTILWILIFTVCRVTPVILAEDKFYCHNLQYAGPIKDVIVMKPTKLAEKTSNAAKIGIGFAKTMISNTLGDIPVVGSILSALFDEIADVYGPGGGLDPEDVYNSLKAEIDKLKEYMDQEILEAKLEDIKNAFGTRNGGILSYAMYCQKTYKNAEDMAPCLENVNALLTSQYHNFLPPDGKPVSFYESSLPLFRMYGQLYVDTLLEMIGAARKRGKESQAAAKADTLINKVARFKEHYEESVKKIKAHHTAVHIMPENNGNCAPLPHVGVTMCVCSIAIGPNKFDEAEIKKKGKSSKDWCVGLYYNSNTHPCSRAKRDYKTGSYHITRELAIQSYWEKQVGETVMNWVKIANELKPLKENMKRSLSFRERIQFDQEVAAYHARVNHGM